MYVPRNHRFWSVGVGHLTNDLFMSAGVVLLTFLSTTLVPMSNTQIGLAVSMQQLSGAISQPFFGIRADRTGGRILGAGGLAWVVTMFLSTILLAITTQNYFLMIIPFILQGIGSGAFHPVGSLHAAESDDVRVASNMSYFFMMGQLGLGIGPALVGFLLDAANPATLIPYSDVTGFPGNGLFSVNLLPIFALGVFAIPSVFYMAKTIARQRVQPEKVAKSVEETSRTRLQVVLPFIIIAAMILLRGLAQPGSVNFIPALFNEKGWSPSEYGLITSSFWIASGITGIIFGGLADRYDRRLIVMISMVLSAPAFFFLPIIDGAPAFLIAVLAGGLSGGSHSLLVVLAQEMIPNSKAFASGAILGFIFGTGALGSLVIGVVSDAIGLSATFQWVAGAAAISGVMALFLPVGRRKAK